MKQTAINIVILSMLLLVSTSGIVLGATKNDTSIMNNIDTNDTKSNVTGVDEPDMTPATGNVAITVGPNKDIETAETVETDIPEDPYTPSKTSEPKKVPVETPKSPGFGFVASVVLISAIYIARRK